MARIKKIIASLEAMKGVTGGYPGSPGDQVVQFRKKGLKKRAAEAIRKAGPERVPLKPRRALSFNEVMGRAKVVPELRKQQPVDIVTMAKRVVAEGGHNYPAHPKSVFYKALVAGGQAVAKRDGCLEATGFARFAATPEGRTLLAATLKAVGPELGPDEEAGRDPKDASPKSPAYLKLQEIARQIMSRNPHYSEAQAFREAAEKNPALLTEDKDFAMAQTSKAWRH